MKRLFIGISIDANNQQTLLTTVKKLKIGADRKEILVKWSPSKNYHATLFFLGKTDHERISEVSDLMKNVAAEHAALKLELKGLGGFNSDRAARVLWVGVQNSRALRDLQSGLSEKLGSLGFVSDDFEFVPHMTIGRLRNPRNCTDLISPFVRKSFGKFTCEQIVLFESVLQGNFPKYIPLYEASLAK